MLKNKGLVVGFLSLIVLVGGLFFASQQLGIQPEALLSPASGTADSVASPTPETKPAETTAAETTTTETATTETTPSSSEPVAVAQPIGNAEGEKIMKSAPIMSAATNVHAPTNPNEIDMAAATAERSIGSLTAPVTVIEYASLTCPHCAHFAVNILPSVKEKLIDTGKLRLIFRDFPMDKDALNAAKMAHCAPKEKFFDLIEVIFRNQERWVTAEDRTKAVQQYGALTGMSEAYMKTCIENPELENNLLYVQNEGQSKYQVQSTPTFVFNNGAEILKGAKDLAEFEAVVNKLSAGK